jgi:hypothetical protein
LRFKTLYQDINTLKNLLRIQGGKKQMAEKKAKGRPKKTKAQPVQEANPAEPKPAAQELNPESVCAQ